MDLVKMRSIKVKVDLRIYNLCCAYFVTELTCRDQGKDPEIWKDRVVIGGHQQVLRDLSLRMLLTAI